MTFEPAVPDTTDANKLITHKHILSGGSEKCRQEIELLIQRRCAIEETIRAINAKILAL